VGRSNSRYRGDEANVDDHQLGGFVLLNLYGELKPSGRLTLFGRIDNMLDREYATFGTYGEADEVLGDDYEDARRFIGPGTPRAVYVGIRLSY
jgi:outer membrane cobalamin receptor